MAGGENNTSDGWLTSTKSEVFSHPVIYILLFIAIIFLLGTKLKNLIPELPVPEWAKFVLRLSEKGVSHVRSFIRGYIITIFSVIIIMAAMAIRLFGPTSAYIKKLEEDLKDDFYPEVLKIELYPDIVPIYMLGSAIILLFFSIVACVAIIVYYRKLSKKVENLEKAKEELVSSVEDATRHVLDGFEKIFDRALSLVSGAERELWMVNFVLNFGQPHRYNQKIIDRYKELPVTESYKNAFKGTRNKNYKPCRDFNSDVTEFLFKLKDKVKEIEFVYILTLEQDSIKSNDCSLVKSGFLDLLYKREDYKKANDQKTIAYESQKIKEAQDLIKSEMNKVEENLNNFADEVKELEGRFYEINNMPIQLFIAGKDGGKCGCLAFMVGTEILGGASQDGDENKFNEYGFYTESENVIQVYRGIAAALMTHAKKQTNQSDKKPLCEYHCKRDANNKLTLKESIPNMPAYFAAQGTRKYGT